jgi:hypothetical protein
MAAMCTPHFLRKPSIVATMIIAARDARFRTLRHEASVRQQEWDECQRFEQELLFAHNLDPERDMAEIDARFPELIPRMIAIGNRQIKADLALREFEAAHLR